MMEGIMAMGKGLIILEKSMMEGIMAEMVAFGPSCDGCIHLVYLSLCVPLGDDKCHGEGQTVTPFITKIGVRLLDFSLCPQTSL